MTTSFVCLKETQNLVLKKKTKIKKKNVAENFNFFGIENIF